MTQTLINRLNSRLNSAQEVLEKFQASLAKDPAYALVWSTGAFKAAAEQRVLRRAIHALQEGATVKTLCEELQSAVLHAAKYPAQSTSPTSNLMEQYELAANAELLSDLKFLVDE